MYSFSKVIDRTDKPINQPRNSTLTMAECKDKKKSKLRSKINNTES